MTDGYVTTAARTNSFGLFSSLRCLWASTGTRQIYGPYERPPFPILVDAPTWGDVFRNMRLSDFFMGGTIYGTGLLWSYGISRPFP